MNTHTEEVEVNEQDTYEKLRVVVDKGQAPERIDKFLMNRMEYVSRSKIQAAAHAGAVLVNDKTVKPNYKVRPNDTIILILPSTENNSELKPENIPLNITYEDDDLIIINKPAGLVVHPGVGNFTGTLMNGVLYHLQQHSKTKEVKPLLLHRIDKNTSGLLVVGKTEFAAAHMSKQFFDHTIDRKYLALAWGDFTEDEGTVEGHIGRHQRFRKIMNVYPDGEIGKHAITHYKVIERFGYTTLIECKLETGRTHQIRVHMQHIKHPLFNDERYGGDKIVKGTVYSKYKQFVDNCFKIIKRQALHAQSLGFVHPTSKKKIHFEAPLPEDMQQVIEKWRGYMQNR